MLQIATGSLSTPYNMPNLSPSSPSLVKRAPALLARLREGEGGQGESSVSVKQSSRQRPSVAVIIRGRRSVVGFFSVLPGGMTYRPLVTTRTAEGKSGVIPLVDWW